MHYTTIYCILCVFLCLLFAKIINKQLGISDIFCPSLFGRNVLKDARVFVCVCVE